MEWRDKKRYSTATSEDGQIDFYIYTNKQGRFYAEGYLMGGQKYNGLPFKDFATAAEAKALVEEKEAGREKVKALQAKSKKINF